MKKAILGTKVGMTQMFREDGTMIPVTVVLAGPCPVVQVKTCGNDGYDAVQVAFGPVREKLITRPELGHLKKAGAGAHRHVRELPLDDTAAFKVGQVIKADIFEKGDRVDIVGVSKGKGFQGNIKRWNQHRGPKTHGSKFHRAPGSMGATSSPGRVFKSKRMPGHYGFETVTIQNLKVVRVDAERNMLLISGAVPGTRGSLLMIRDAVKKQ